jgi:O-antigen ligase
MRTLVHPSLGQSNRSSFALVAGALGLIGGAVLTGVMIAQERWLVLAFALVVILALQWPIEVGLGLYAFLLPFNAITALGDSASGTTANYALGIVAGMAILGTGVLRKRLSFPPREAIWWSLFLLWSILSTAWALELRASIHLLPTAISLGILYLVAVSWRLTDKEFTVLTWLIVAGGLVASCYVAYQFSHGISFITNFGLSSGRASLVVGDREANPNYLGTDLLLPFALALAGSVSARRWLGMLMGIGVAAIISLAIFLTGSRGSLLAMGVILAIFLVRLRFQRRLLVLLALFFLSAVALPGSFFARIQTAVSDAGSGRLDIWLVGLAALKRYGIVGAGLGNFNIAYAAYAGYAPSFRGIARGAHNIYLEAGVELGILGVLLMSGAFISHIYAVRQRRLVGDVPSIRLLALECACWATLLAGFFEGIVWSKSPWLTWTLCLMALKLKQGGRAETGDRTLLVEQGQFPSVKSRDRLRQLDRRSSIAQE